MLKARRHNKPHMLLFVWKANGVDPDQIAPLEAG